MSALYIVRHCRGEGCAHLLLQDNDSPPPLALWKLIPVEKETGQIVHCAVCETGFEVARDSAELQKNQTSREELDRIAASVVASLVEFPSYGTLVVERGIEHGESESETESESESEAPLQRPYDEPTEQEQEHRKRRAAAWRPESEDVKDHPQWICPLTMDVFYDPVVAADGQSYERWAIEKWLATHITSPSTNESLQHRHLVENVNLRSSIEQYTEGVVKRTKS